MLFNGEDLLHHMAGANQQLEELGLNPDFWVEV